MITALITDIFKGIAEAFKVVWALCEVVPGGVWAIIAAFLVLSSCSKGNEIAALNTAIGQERQAVAAKEAERARVALEATQLRAEISAFRAQRAQEISDATHREFRQTELAIVAEQPVRDQLRNDTAALTAASSGTGVRDPRAPQRAEETARALGGLLEACDAVAEGLGRDVEDLATQVRGLIAGYESLLVNPALDPAPDRDKVHPGPGLRRNDVVLTALPYAPHKPGVDFRLSLFRVASHVVGQRHPAAHHDFSDPP